MPHQCVHCGKLYPTASRELLAGCSCGSHFFFFVKDEALQALQEETAELSKEEKKEIESDIREIIGIEEEEKPVILDIESVHAIKPGKFEIDLVNLFKKKPLVYKIEDGKYIIDIASTFLFEKERKKLEEGK